MEKLKKGVNDLLSSGSSAPPSYGTSPSQAGWSGDNPAAPLTPAATPTLLSVPSGTNRALAPLAISKKDRSIRKNYAVILGPDSEPGVPDVSLQTSDGDIKTGLYLQGRTDRPARIELRTSDGSIRLKVHREPGQALDVQCVTKDGRVYVWLPSDFDGLATGHSKHGSIKLSAGLKERAVLYPSPPGTGKGETRQTWAIAPAHQHAHTPGADRLWAQTKDAGVRLKLAGEKDDDEVWDVVEGVWSEILG